MSLRNFFRFIFISGFILLIGCTADWEKKLIRKKKHVVRPPLYEVEKKQRPYPELYREHFGFWKGWHRQLIEDLDKNRKRQLQDIDEARRHLNALQKYVIEEKAKEVQELVKEFDWVTRDLRNHRLSATSPEFYGNRLEGLRNKIDHKLHHKKMKDFFLPTPIPLDMEKYEGDEPVIQAPEPSPAAVKAEDQEADMLKDDKRQITYEDYRAQSPA